MGPIVQTPLSKLEEGNNKVMYVDINIIFIYLIENTSRVHEMLFILFFQPLTQVILAITPSIICLVDKMIDLRKQVCCLVFYPDSLPCRRGTGISSPG